ELLANAVDLEVSDVSEVDLRLFAGRRVVDPHGRRPLAPGHLLVNEAAQRGVADVDALAKEQLADTPEPQRSLTAEPGLDANTLRFEHRPRLRCRRHRTRLNALRD